MKKIEQINDTTYKITPNDNEFERLEIEIGDAKQPDFKPQVKLMKWTNECNFSVRAIDDEAGKFTPRKVGKKIKLVKNKREYHFYEDGENFEFEVILKEKPKTNVIKMSIQTKGLKFYYQPPLTEEITDEQKAKGWTATETDIKDDKGNVVCHRPENVVGSYAVYHESKSGDYHLMGGKNYRAGKAFHIYRPKIVDSVGDWVWGELNIDEKKGVLSVEIPQEFLDNAVYPIRHAAGLEFGYHVIGGSGSWTNLDTMKGSLFTSPADADKAVSVSVYYYNLDLNKHFKGILVTHSNLNIISNGIGNATDILTGDGDDWRTSTFATSPTISANTEYVIMQVCDDGVYLKYDSGDTNQGHIDDSNSYSSPANPTDATHDNNKYSIYCTYTAEEGGYTSPFPAFRRP